jgi:hypothetical protein
MFCGLSVLLVYTVESVYVFFHRLLFPNGVSNFVLMYFVLSLLISSFLMLCILMLPLTVFNYFITSDHLKM